MELGPSPAQDGPCLAGHAGVEQQQSLRETRPSLGIADQGIHPHGLVGHELQIFKTPVSRDVLVLLADGLLEALDLDVAKIKAGLNLLDGIHAEVVELLKDKPISGPALRLFRKAKAVRQIDMAQLMVSANNFTRSYAEALIVGTPADQLLGGRKSKQVPGISEAEFARMEKEMETLERDYRLHQEQFGENALHLNATQRYVNRLLENAKVKRFLGNRYPEILEELQAVAALEAI